MPPTAAELHAWYATLHGRRVARALGAALAPVMRIAPGQRIVAVGYAGPALTGLDPARVEQLALAMPHAQGWHRWPARRPGCAVAVDPLALPFTEGLFDQALVIHALEHCDPPRRLLRELWRVLAPAGELVVVVPNRFGLWPHLERGPFGAGRGFTRGQLHRVLIDAMFEPTRHATALVAPPVGMLRPLGDAVGAVTDGLGAVRLAVATKSDGLAPALAGRRARVAVLRPA